MKTRLAQNLLALFLFAALIAGAVLIVSHPVEAQGAKSGLSQAAGVAYGSSTPKPIGTIIGGVIRSVIQVSGVVLLVLVVYAGILYLIAAGDDAKIKKAKSMLSSSVIGLILILGAYALTEFVLIQLKTIT